MNEKNEKQIGANQKIGSQKNDNFPAKLAILPEQTVMTSVKQIKFDPTTAATINTADLLEEVVNQCKKIHEGDTSQIERYLYSQAIALDALFDRMLAQTAAADFTPHLQLSCTLALKAQAQSRATFTALAQLKCPDQTTFIKQLIQQNNAVNQQVNNEGTTASTISKNSEKVANELLSEVGHETLDFRGTPETVTINPAMEAMATINRSKIT